MTLVCRLLNDRENRRGNQERTIQKHWVHKTQDEDIQTQKQNTRQKTKKCKTKIKKSFTKILTIILSVKIVVTLRVKLPCTKCKILIVREILVLSFIVSEKIEKKMDDVLALRLENKRAIHR